MVGKTIARFAEKIAGPAAEEIGFMLQDSVRVYRLKNQLRLMEKAEKYLREAGVDPKAVPFRTLLPILEKGSLEDNDELNDRWAALLANAADASADIAVPPSFPNILEELSPLEVQVLDFLYENLKDEGLKHAIPFSDIETACGVERDPLYVTADNLDRLGLGIHGNESRPGLAIPGGEMEDHKYTLELRSYEMLGLTALGKAFVKACRREVH